MTQSYYRLLNLLFFLVGGLYSYSQTTETFTSSGSWSVPCGVTSVTISVWGGGGGGGGSTSNGFGGSGGGGGAMVTNTFVVTPGDVINYTIGAGGAGGSYGNGAAGGQSTVTGFLINMTADGGTGGGTNSGAVGTGATTGTGGAITSGSNGTVGGGTGGTGGDGANAPGTGGAGGTNVAGTAGTAPGGGGGGGEHAGGGPGVRDRAGGNGAGGQITFTYTTVITTPNAGADQNACNTLTITGNTPDAGWTSTWAVVSGTGTIADPSATSTTIDGITFGGCTVLSYTFSLAGCADMTDFVTLCAPVNCNDDPCGAIVLPLNTTCVPTTFAGVINASTTETTSVPRPGCGQFGQFDNAQDVWFEVGPVPADGNLNVDMSGLSGDYVSAAIYEGTCSSLTSLGCYQNSTSGGTLNIQQSGLTPGSTVFIRVWDYFDQQPMTLNICAYENPTDSEINPGDNNITCGTTYLFTDLGGSSGNYANNTTTTYTICPDDPSQVVTVSFSSVSMASSLDHIMVLNGSQGAAQLIGDFSSGTPTYTSTADDGCLTFIFQSNASSVAAGWQATVSCATPAAGDDANHLTGTCSEQNCLGGCLRTLCGIPATVGFQGDGFGNQELNESTNGCWTAAERCSNWFYINPINAGELSMNMFVNSGQDQDFLVWEAFGNELQCPAETGNDPLLCNYAGATAEGTGWNDTLVAASNPAYEPQLTITQDDIDNGIYYIILIQTFNNGGSCPQPNVDVTFGGDVQLSCDPPIPLGLNLVDLYGWAEDAFNVVNWETFRDIESDRYIVERSNDGNNWYYVGTVNSNKNEGAGQYRMIDNEPYKLTYYRLWEIDVNGTKTTSHSIVVSRENVSDTWISDVFPNPGQNYTSFVYYGNDKESPLEVKIVNTLGQEIFYNMYENLHKGNGYSIDLTNLADGFYEMVFIQNDKKITKRISVIH